MEEFVVVWSRYDEKIRCVVGHLIYDDKKGIWTFFYDQEGFSLAYKAGFRGFSDFQDISGTYQSKELFELFNLRLHREDDSNRIGDVANSEKLEILRTVGAKLYTDNISIDRKRPSGYGKN